MALLTWSEKMSVGVPLLDSDHQVLMNIINSLEATARSPRERDRTDEHFQTLMRYTTSHFGREEEVMTACGFPTQDSHRKEHLRFIQEIEDLARRVGRGNNTKAVDELFAYLSDWWNHHILIQDMAYRPYAEGNADADTAALALPPLFVAANTTGPTGSPSIKEGQPNSPTRLLNRNQVRQRA